MTKDYKPELACAVHAAKTAGARLRRAFHSGESDVDTRAEQEIQQILSSAFPTYGYRGEELGLVRNPDAGSGNHCWLVDPDDGTEAFKKGFRGAAVSIALLRDGRPVLGVVYAYCAPDDNGDLFTWAEGMDHIERNGYAAPPPPQGGGVPDTVLVSHHADHNSRGNALAVAPMRFRAIPSIAYRLALVAAGEACVANSINGPTGWDYAGGHALLLGAGLDLYDASGESIRYDRTGQSSCSGSCFGGSRPAIQKLLGRDWGSVTQRKTEAHTPYPLFWPKRRSTVDDAGLLSRAQGCMLGQLAGDALGGLVEFQKGETIRHTHSNGVRKLIDGGHWNTLGGQPTDDSEMALALARSILNKGGYDPEAAAAAYRWWYESGPYDIGATTATALSSEHAVPSQDSQANGALMRVSPIGILGAGQPAVGKTGEWAQEDARITHPNPVCQHSNRVFAESIAFAIRTGSAPDAVYRFALEEAAKDGNGAVHKAIDSAATKPPADYYSQMGWVLIALQNAFWQLLHAETLEQGVVDTVMAGGDTDTNAAIAGALLGAVHGRPGIPLQWLDRTLTCRPINGLPGVRRPRPEAFWPVDALWIAEHLLWLGP